MLGILHIPYKYKHLGKNDRPLTSQEFDMDQRQAQVFHQSIKNSEHLETVYGQEALAPTREQGISI